MPEKRQHPRFRKQYEINFILKDKPQKIYEMSLMLDISRSGLKFVSSEYYPPGTKIIFNIQFPFLYPQLTFIEGEVVWVDHVPRAETFKIRSRFINVSPSVAAVLEQMERFNLKRK